MAVIPNQNYFPVRGLVGQSISKLKRGGCLRDEHKQVLFSVKSGHVGVDKISEFCHRVDSEKAAIGIFITLEEPTKPMIKEAKNMGTYLNPLTHQEYSKIEIVTIKELLDGKRLNLPQAVKVLKDAQKNKEVKDNPMGLAF